MTNEVQAIGLEGLQLRIGGCELCKSHGILRRWPKLLDWVLDIYERGKLGYFDLYIVGSECGLAYGCARKSPAAAARARARTPAVTIVYTLVHVVQVS